MQNRDLKNIYRKISRLLVIVLAARALIPIGYMVAFPAGDQAGLALHLCPSQNSQHLVNALADNSASHHHHRADAHSSAADGNAVMSVSAECRAWVTTSIGILNVAETLSPLTQWATLPPIWSNEGIAAQAPLLSAYPRAPPQLFHA